MSKLRMRRCHVLLLLSFVDGYRLLLYRTSGFVFVGDREMAVKRIDNTDEWREVTEQQSEGLAISPASHHGSFHDLPSTSFLS